MRRFNIDALLKTLILLGFPVSFLILIYSGDIRLYLNPRMIKYVIIAIVVMVVMAYFSIRELKSIRRKNTSIITYSFFILPLIISLIYQPVTIGSDSLPSRRINLERLDNIRNNEEISDNIVQVKKGKIIIDDNNFVYKQFELNYNLEENIGREITMEGFVHKNEDFRENEFVIARFVMICCAADMQMTGLMGAYDQTPDLEEYSWVRVEGIVDKSSFNETEIPAIIIKNLELIEKPEIEYVYPNF